jgi:hypothetical protein
MKKIQARFYRTVGGTEPVREFLKELDPADKRIVGQDVATSRLAGLSGCLYAGLLGMDFGKCAVTFLAGVLSG